MPNMPKPLSTILIIISVILLHAALFFVLGKINKKNFEEEAVSKAQIVLEKYFDARDETLMTVVSAAYKFDGVEFEVYTDRNIYYAFIVVNNTFFETDTILNLVAKPKLSIHMVEPKYN